MKKVIIMFLMSISVISLIALNSNDVLASVTEDNRVREEYSTTVREYVESNYIKYQESSSTYSDGIWVGHDMAIITNPAFEDFFSKTKDGQYEVIHDYGYGNNWHDNLDFRMEIERDFNYYYVDEDIYSGKEYYFFTKEAITDHIDELQRVKQLIDDEANREILEIQISETVVDGVLLAVDITLFVAGVSNPVITISMLAISTFKLLESIFVKGEDTYDVSEQIHDIINALTSIKSLFKDGQNVAILQENYKVHCNVTADNYSDLQNGILRHLYSIDISYRTPEVVDENGDKLYPNYEYIYFNMYNTGNNEKDILNNKAGTDWERVFPNPFPETPQVIASEPIWYKDITKINGESYDSNSSDHFSLTQHEIYDWYRFDITEDKLLSLQIVASDGSFAKPFDVYIFDEEFNQIVGKSTSSTYVEYNYSYPTYLQSERIYNEIEVNNPGSINTYYVLVTVGDRIPTGTIFNEEYDIHFSLSKAYYLSYDSQITIEKTYYTSSYELDMGDYIYRYTSGQKFKYNYDYEKHKYYDKMSFNINQRRWYGDKVDAYIYTMYMDEAPSLSLLPGKRAFTTSSMSSSYTCYFYTNYFYYGGKQIYYSRDDAPNNGYYVDDYTTFNDYRYNYYGTYNTGWLTDEKSDGKDGDYYYDYFNESNLYKVIRYKYDKINYNYFTPMQVYENRTEETQTTTTTTSTVPTKPILGDFIL